MKGKQTLFKVLPRLNILPSYKIPNLGETARNRADCPATGPGGAQAVLNPIPAWLLHLHSVCTPTPALPTRALCARLKRFGVLVFAVCCFCFVF